MRDELGKWTERNFDCEVMDLKPWGVVVGRGLF